MERIIKVGQYVYDIVYNFENEALKIESIHAVCELIVFDHAMPILFERSDRITLTDAKRLSIDMGGNFPLHDAMVTELSKINKSEPRLQAIV